jgi:glycosyltransferase involved in cell wall biosynthesis
LYNIKKIAYWSPSLVDIATNKAVMNSAYSLLKYNNKFEPFIMNFFGEFNRFESNIYEKKIKLINYYSKNFLTFLPKYGRVKSRISFILIFLFSFLPLKSFLKKNNPDFLIIHLITSLPLFLLILFDFKTKFILRISGMPKLGIFRKFLWKIALRKIYKVTCPTINTLNYIKSLNIVDSEKLILLYDPVLELKKIKKFNIDSKELFKVPMFQYCLAAGRLTAQKNFLFLCESFSKIITKYPDFKLIIAGEGEDKNKILSLIKKKNLENNIILVGHVYNIYHYMRNAKFFILSSLWEDPGFVLLEAAISRTLVVSSDCDSGPKELIKDNLNGLIYSSNSSVSLVQKLEYAILIKNEEKRKMILNNLRQSKKFTLFYHYRELTKILF